MSLSKSQALQTVDEYLALERASEERHEYLDGEVFAMAGESPEHGAICTNLVAELRNQLKGTRCQAFSKDLKVRSGPLPMKPRSMKGLFSYPDVVIVCGEPQFLDEHRDVLLNPAVIIEVLSPTTEAFDLGEKFRQYRTFSPSLTDYLVVAQRVPLVEHFKRNAEGIWFIAASVQEVDGTVEVASIDCSLRLDEVYDRVAFGDTESKPAEERFPPLSD